ncbi:MAG: hypothetical protein M5U12_16500 [Verrucomicrobia bacterium]|nr:hypothetical protein [Verrucomicrobiota bacterium]
MTRPFKVARSPGPSGCTVVAASVVTTGAEATPTWVVARTPA